MTGHWNWPMDWQLDQQLDRHILAYILCKFEAYSCRNNWQMNLKISVVWADGQTEIKKMTGCWHQQIVWQLDQHILA